MIFTVYNIFKRYVRGASISWNSANVRLFSHEYIHVISRLGLRLALGDVPFVVLGVHQFGDDLSRMATRVELIRMRRSLPFASLFPTVPGEDVLIVVIVEMLVLVTEFFGVHSCDVHRNAR